MRYSSQSCKIIYFLKPVTQNNDLQVGIAIPGLFSNPSISGLEKRPGFGIPGLQAARDVVYKIIMQQ